MLIIDYTHVLTRTVTYSKWPVLPVVLIIGFMGYCIVWRTYSFTYLFTFIVLHIRNSLNIGICVGIVMNK